MPHAYPLALIIAAYLALTGYRKGSLSTSGAIAAFFIGYLTLANPVKAFGLTLLGFYLLGSKATKIGHEIKTRLEREYIVEDPKRISHKAKSGGQRNWVQVCCNGLGGALTSLAFRIFYSNNWQGGFKWCLLKDSRPIPVIFMGFQFDHQTFSILPRSLFLMMLGHFACCMGDTLASETGILAKKHPRLVLPPFRHVPPGTNGGLSIQGTLGSIIGGALMGLISGLSLLLIDNSACQHQMLGNPLLKIILLGAFAGFGGSMVSISFVDLGLFSRLLSNQIDSLLGATLQRTLYNKQTKQVLLGRIPGQVDQTQWQVITGRDILSNNSVNLLSSFTTALLTALIGSRAFH